MKITAEGDCPRNTAASGDDLASSLSEHLSNTAMDTLKAIAINGRSPEPEKSGNSPTPSHIDVPPLTGSVPSNSPYTLSELSNHVASGRLSQLSSNHALRRLSELSKDVQS
jgi:hypothetical protein